MKINLNTTKKILVLIILCLVCKTNFAHDMHTNDESIKTWIIEKENRTIKGTFFMFKNGDVYIEDAYHQIKHFPLTSFKTEDQKKLKKKIERINLLNEPLEVKNISSPNKISTFQLGIILILLILFGCVIFFFTNKKQHRYTMPVFFASICFTLFSFTNPTIINNAFMFFAPNVNTSWDNNYFYVESKGIPTTHDMMVGISNHGWQQQVPIPQCYIGSNAWSIPLNPIMATTPIPVNADHFSRGALAIAVNGVPIFNPYTNTGVDAFLDGQLDAFGGHCGKADDYHYHTAPLHLYNQTTSTLPIAYAFDGFAVFGSLEPDGSAMTTLDANHGHLFNDVYHYHGSSTAPYMIGNMVGVVTEDATKQIIPQAQSQPVRTENWGPLNGALINSCVANANNGYNTSYSLNQVSGYATNYTKLSASPYTYTFQYVTPTGTTTTNYIGQANCVVPNLAATHFIALEQKIKLFPNPATDILQINLGDSDLEEGVQSISLCDLNARILFKTNHFIPSLDIKNVPKGNYIVKIQFENSVVTKKIIVK